MRLLNIVQFNKVSLYKNTTWFVIGIFYVLLIAQSISGEMWVLLGALLVPLLIYISIKKPFIFPFGLYVFLLPFDAILSVTGSTTGATLTKYLGVLTILVLTLKGIFEGKLKRPETPAIWWVLFVGYAALSILWSIEPKLVLSRLPTILGLLLVYLVVALYEFDKKEYETIKWIIFISGITAALLTIYTYLQGSYYEKSSGSAAMRASVMIFGRGTNPNNIAFNFLFPISIGFSFMLKQNKKLVKGIFLIILGLIIFALLTTGSRSGMLAVGTVIMVYMLSIKRKVTFGTAITGILIIAISIAQNFVYGRWTNAVDTGGAGRLNIWYVGWRALEKYWVSGAGLANFGNAYTEFANYSPQFEGLNRAAHNMLLNYFVELGIIGISLFFIAIWKHYQSIKLRSETHNQEAIMLKATFWGMLVSSQFMAINLTNKFFWLLWMMILMHKNSVNMDAKEVFGEYVEIK